jgi:hypothetical protein
VKRAIVAVLATCGALAAAEAATRLIDGYRLTSPRLRVSDPWVFSRGRSSPSQKWFDPANAWPYVQRLPAAAGVDREWFAERLPDRPPPKPDADLLARARRYPNVDLQSNYEWNWQFAVDSACRTTHHDGGEIFDNFQDVYVFDPTDGSPFPRFRFLRNAAYPSGLRTNAFGWPGPDVPLNRRRGSIRVAFVGASTTISSHDQPYAYPEIVGLLLERWARLRHPDVAFDVVNAAREGINSESIQAIVRQEVAPLDPDLVVYYEGANQFWPANFVPATLPLRGSTSGPPPSRFAMYSAIARRVDSAVRRAVMPGSEPPKPQLPVEWPKDLDERDPNLAHPLLPIELPRILGDLDLIREALSPGGRLVMTSFMWLEYPGLVVDPVRDAVLFDYMNVKYWPFTYAHMRRYLDFQAQAFRKYAATHGLDFIDVAGEYPKDLRLFSDPIHMVRGGIHLQAWIVFNHLVPIIERRLASGEWPRPPRQELAAHPAFGPRRLVPVQTIRAQCAAGRRPPSRNASD